jgi:hypothetical protein
VSRNYEIVIHKYKNRDSIPPKLKQVFDGRNVDCFPTTVTIDPSIDKYVKDVKGYDREQWLRSFR